MKTFDDFDEVSWKTHPGHPQLAISAKDDTSRPKVGETFDGHRILRCKPISAVQITKFTLENEDVAKNLLFLQHKTRPFVLWLVEAEKEG